MNHKDIVTLTLNRQTFDRLVDGALSADEYRSVLLALEQQPAAWRLCAEAFLEAQAWRGDFSALRQSSIALPVLPAGPKPTPASETRQRAAQSTRLNMALIALASFFLAFAVVQSIWQRLHQRPDRDSQTPAVNVLAQPTPPSTGNSPTIPTTLVSHQPFGKVQLPVDRGEGQEPAVVDVPVYEDAAASALLINSRPALPDDLVQSLEAEGHRVDLERQFLRVPLNDGRQMMLPVEGYRIVPVNRPSY